MIIKDIKVDWMEKWDNDPQFNIIVDKIPNILDLEYEERNGLYLATTEEGYAHFIYKQNPNIKDDGFAGRKFECKMKDGSKRSWYGGWSSRAGCINKYYPEIQVLDVAYQTDEYNYPFIASAITLNALEKAFSKLRIRKFEIKKVRQSNEEIVYLPKIKHKYLTKMYYNEK